MLALFLALLTLPAAAQQTKWNPAADPQAMVVEGTARFTVLTPRLIRMEWASDGHFEDHASLVFVNRRLPVPQFTATHENGWLVLRTASGTIRYNPTGAFTKDNLRADFGNITWTPGMEDKGNLGGTIRTLDGVKGSTSLGSGLLKSPVSYYRHSAFRGRFARYAGDWFLEIVPTYHFTRDGHRPSLFAEDLLKGIKRREHNPAILGQLFMWVHVLSTPRAPLLGASYPFLSFGKLETFPIHVGIEDDEWIKQEPPGDRAALEEAGQELLTL
jgi:hypothetical protein